MNEHAYRRNLVTKIKDLFPDCVVMKNDPREMQGVPDILILWNAQWAMLEIKIGEKAKKQPNQDYYVARFNQMSFASFINPETEEEVLNALQSAFRPRRKARVPQP
jgi:hypothetical protein